MVRKISRNPNQILKRKPNQFPTARFQEIKWGKNCPVTESKSNGDEEDAGETEPGTGEDLEKLNYLRNRFNQPTCECSPDP